MTQKVYIALCVLMFLATPVFVQESGVDADSSAPIEQTDTVGALVDERTLPIDDNTNGLAVDDAPGTRAVGFRDVLRMLLVLTVVILIIYATFSLLKRASRSQIRSSTLIHSLSNISLGGNRALHLIRLGERHYLIGSAEQNVQLIETIEDPDTINYIKQNKDTTAHNANEQGFKQRIRTLLGSVKKQNKTPTPTPNSQSPPLSSADIMTRISNNHVRLKDV